MKKYVKYLGLCLGLMQILVLNEGEAAPGLDSRLQSFLKSSSGSEMLQSKEFKNIQATMKVLKKNPQFWDNDIIMASMLDSSAGIAVFQLMTGNLFMDLSIEIGIYDQVEKFEALREKLGDGAAEVNDLGDQLDLLFEKGVNDLGLERESKVTEAAIAEFVDQFEKQVKGL